VSAPREIPLGFEVGTGRPIAIPLKHLAITGQTQESGKTTTLEALITRSQLRAVTFITKRGEGSFTTARRIEPYFRERADWQFVAAILEASRGEKLKFERAWIIRASRGARTLADVHRNVREALKTAKGLSGDVYLTLDAYLEVVVPQIARVRWATGVTLAAGINAVDLTGLTVELQHLVIKSTLDWVFEREADTVVVVPEAWKFIPQGRGTPVKLAAEAFIRQAAALHNFLWLDSQDLGGIEKTILRSVPVWILGVQRETNEITRTLANIPGVIAKPKPTDIAVLELGQFYACWGTHAIRTYVQPVWLDPDTAREVARGRAVASPAPRREEAAVTPADAQALRADNERLRRQVDELTAELQRLREPERRARDEDRRAVVRRTADPDLGPARAAPRAFTPAESFDNEQLYQAFKARLLAELPQEPAVLAVLTARPELRVEVERVTIEAKGSTLSGRLALLIAEGWFDDARTGSAAYTELKRRGFACAKPNVYRESDKLAQNGFLTKESDGYRAVPGMKVNIVDVER
jgi:hypothetical protein